MAVEVRSDHTLLKGSLDEARQAWDESLVDIEQLSEAERIGRQEKRKTQLNEIAESLPEHLRDAYWQNMPDIRDEATTESNQRIARHRRQD